jgi:hypothetical protein
MGTFIGSSRSEQLYVVVMALLLMMIGGSMPVVNNISYAAIPNDTQEFKIYDPDDPNSPENIVIQYCILHADRVAQGANVSQELVNAGIIPDFFAGKTCQEVQAQHERTKAALDFGNKDTLKEILGIR